MKLYSKPGACSLADHIALRWAGLPFELKLLDAAAMKAPAYLAINPAGAVPALQMDDWVLTQNSAILNYIADLAPDAHLAGDGSPRSRAEVQRWLAFLNADLHPAFHPLFGSTRYLDDAAVIARTQEHARERVRTLYTRVEAALEQQTWLGGARRSIADAYLFVTLRWARAQQIALGPNLQLHFERMSADPQVQAALQAEGLS
ncbi:MULTISPECIES: glutathione S-transferase N-terminal domain-containing protein [Xanthomonas]|uniref:glutathione S-transferase N-terminal domain-containing protein n=1 Tax=Xanthomonas TaxID=338 RepID=UPI001AD9F312|nr:MULTISPECIES: glutathione S-transferase N-terminal domain-containing protein [unclassified Xanthomonas]MBO9874992.1 glutathione S-transferase N-terminal domain-containing protein [Xanthomonas sp. D-93]WNH45726.1 glutathione binding-like protein [Xanthomonas sp. A6251]